MKIINRNQIDILIPKKYIKRDLSERIEKDLYEKEIQIIYGPRQVGKSSLMYNLMKKMYKDDIDMFYFNLDQPDEVFGSAEVFMSDIASRRKYIKETYIFIDEIQRKKDIGLFLKYIYDRNPGYKFVVTGSSSLSIKNIINEPLTGRKIEYFLAPLTVFEILNFKGIAVQKLSRATPSVFDTIDEYLLYGGYPEVVLKITNGEKVAKLAEIAKSYITRDLRDTFALLDTAQLESVAVYLAQNTGNILSKENIARTLSVSVHKVNTYLEILEKSFVIGLLKPFFKNPVKELAHRPKTYFLDNGIRNALLQKTNRNLISADIGSLFEQTVWQLLEKDFHGSIRYWRNNNQTEVDFIVEKSGKLSVFETKYSYDRNRLPKNLLGFQNIYRDSITDCKIITRENLIALIH